MQKNKKFKKFKKEYDGLQEEFDWIILSFTFMGILILKFFKAGLKSKRGFPSPEKPLPKYQVFDLTSSQTHHFQAAGMEA